MGVEVVHGSGIPECRVWTIGIVGDFPGTQSRLESSEVEGAVMTIPELFADGAIEALDEAVEFGRVRGQDVKRDAGIAAGEFELTHESGATIDHHIVSMVEWRVYRRFRFACHFLDKPCGAEPPYRVDHVEGDAVEVMGLQDIVVGHEFQ